MTNQSGTARYPAVVALLRRERASAAGDAAMFDRYAESTPWRVNVALYRDRAAASRELVRQIDATLAALAGASDGE